MRNQADNSGSSHRRAAPNRHAPDCPLHGHHHASNEEDDANDEGSEREGRANDKGKEKAKGKRKPSPNAYEKMPHYNRPDRPGV